jgi:hypothetical protein
MTLLCDAFIFEQEEPVEQPQPSNNDFEGELLPLKKYHLVQRLYTLQYQLDQKKLQNKDLNTILLFNKELSYDTIVHLIKGILPFLQQQIKGATINEKQK